MANKNNEVIGLEELSIYDALIKHYIDNKSNSSGESPMTLDSILSLTSTNAVQNKAILETFSSLVTGIDPSSIVEDESQLAVASHAKGQYFYIKTSVGYLIVAKALKAIAVGDSFSYDNNIEMLTPLSIRVNQMANTPITLPTASTSTLGGVKVDGTTITIDNNGVISSVGGGGGNSGTSTSIEVNSNDSIGTENNLVYLKVNGTSYKAFTLYDISGKNFCYRLNYEFQDTTDDEKYNLNSIGTEIYGENLNFYGPKLSFINASIYISESSNKTLYMPISSTVDFSNIYSSGPLANVKLTFYITREGNTWYLNIKKSTPINLSTYGTTAILQILY